MGKVNSHYTGKVWEKKQTFQSFSNILVEAEIHTIPKIWEKGIRIVRTNVRKHIFFFRTLSLTYILTTTNISKLSVSEVFRLMQKSMQFAKHGKSEFP